MDQPEPVTPLPETAPTVPAARGRRGWYLHLILIGAYPLVLGLLGWNQGPARAPALTNTARGLIITCLVQLAIFGFVFFLGWLASRASREDLLLRWRGGLWPIPLGVAYSVALRFGLAVVALVLFVVLLVGGVVTAEQAQDFTEANRPDVSAMVDIAALRSDPLYFWLSITVVSFVVAGLREELWRAAVLAGCRALWPRWFSSTGGQIAAVALSAVVFGLGHLSMGVIAVAAATLLGLGLGVIMVLHRSIWPAVIAHGMFDATTFALLPWVMERLPRA